MLTIDNFDDFLMDGTEPKTQAVPTSTNPPTTGTPTTPVDVTAITSALSAAMLTKPPTSRTNIFMKNKGCGDDVKPLKEAKQWNAWHRTFLSVAHSHDFMDITDPTYVPNPSDDDACTLFDAQQKHAFGILVSSIKESSMLPTKHYEDACEVLHKLSKSKSLSPAQNYLVLTMLLGRSFVSLSFLYVHRDAYLHHIHSRHSGAVPRISSCCFPFHSGPVRMLPGCFLVFVIILIFQQHLLLLQRSSVPSLQVAFNDVGGKIKEIALKLNVASL